MAEAPEDRIGRLRLAAYAPLGPASHFGPAPLRGRDEIPGAPNSEARYDRRRWVGLLDCIAL
jgi:hypothetical protein